MSSPFKHTPGYARVANLLTVDHRKHPGRPIRSRTLEGFTAAEQEDVMVAFGRHHVQLLPDGKIRIHVDRIIRDDHAGEEPRFWEVLEQSASPPSKPKADPRETVAASLASFPDGPLREHLLAQLKGNGWLGRLVQQDGSARALDECQILVKVADALHPPLSEPTSIKTFASRVLNDSHKLDPNTPLYRHITDYLATTGEFVDGNEPDWRRQLLEDHNLYNSAIDTLVHLAGPIVLTYDDGEDDRISRNFQRGLTTALTMDEVAQVRAATAPRFVISCEGPVPFAQLARARPANVALVCTRGHPNPAVRRFLQILHSSGANIRHWGDTDVGGFRVLGSLRRSVPVQAVLMDATTIRRYADRLTRYSETKRQHTEAQFARLDAAAQHTLRACLDRNGWLEQESVPVQDALRQLEQVVAA